MHKFDYSESPRKLLTTDVVNMIASLHEFKGKQEFNLVSKGNVLSSLLDIAKIQSTKSSNRIEGIYTSDERLVELVVKKSEPHNRSEQEIAGYREVLATIHESYEYIPIKSNSILQLHRDLYAFSASEIGGSFKNTDNVILETSNDGKDYVRFTPVPAFQTPDAINELCRSFNEAISRGEYDPLILIPMYVLDFLCIHPFNDGNGRISRLLTLLLLYRAGYLVGKYISLEMLIEKTKQSYYDVLKTCSVGWHDNHNDYLPFVKYYLGIVLKAYRELENRMQYMNKTKFSKPERVKAVFDKKLGSISKADIVAQCPDISITTIERTLKDLLDLGYIKKIGAGRGTTYIKQ